MFTTQYWRPINSSLWGVKCCFLLECSDLLSEVKSIVITSFLSKTSYQQLLLQFYNCATAQSGDDCEKSKLSHFLAVTQSPFLLPHLLFWIYSYLLRFCSSVSQFSTVSNSYPPNHRPTVYPQSSTVPQNGLFLYYSPHLLNSHSCLVAFLSVVQKKQFFLHLLRSLTLMAFFSGLPQIIEQPTVAPAKTMSVPGDLKEDSQHNFEITKGLTRSSYHSTNTRT